MLLRILKEKNGARNIMVCMRLQCDQIGRFIELGNFLKHLATINLPKSPTFLGNFCKNVKIFNFSSEIIFGQILLKFGDFFWSHCESYTTKKLCLQTEQFFLSNVLNI